MILSGFPQTLKIHVRGQSVAECKIRNKISWSQPLHSVIYRMLESLAHQFRRLKER